MRSGSLSMSTRRAVFGVITVALLCGASGIRAQQQGGAPAGGAAPPVDQFLFTSDAGQVIFQVKADKTADFESFWTEFKTKLSASDKPDMKAMGDSLTLYKHAVGGTVAASGSAVYILTINPPVKGQSYDPGKVLFSPGSLWDRKDADPLYKKLSDSLDGINVLPLTKVTK